MLGFTTQPVDHYMRTFYMVDAVAAGPRPPGTVLPCSGSEPRHRLMLRAMRQFIEAYPSRLKFSFLFHSEYSHRVNHLRWVDDDLRDQLEYLLNDGHLERSLLVLMSDHGTRFQVAHGSMLLYV